MRTEEEIRNVLKGLNTDFFRTHCNKEQLKGAIKAFEWVLEEQKNE